MQGILLTNRNNPAEEVFAPLWEYFASLEPDSRYGDTFFYEKDSVSLYAFNEYRSIIIRTHQGAIKMEHRETIVITIVSEIPDEEFISGKSDIIIPNGKFTVGELFGISSGVKSARKFN